MSERDIKLLLIDIAEAIELIFIYVKDYTFDEYINDLKTREAVERNFEIIGEAASNIPNSYKMMNNENEWRVLKDFRNFIIHDYFGINHKIVLYTIIYPNYWQ